MTDVDTGLQIILNFLRRLTFLKDRGYLSVAATHFWVDVMNNGRTLLVALLAVEMALSNARVGALLLLYNLGSALSQPLFGLLADRFGARWLVVGGLGWMMTFYSLGALLPSWPALIAITIASLGSGSFHPSGTKVASESSDSHRTQATAFFFMSGQMGLFFGPILAGYMMDWFNRPGYVVLPLLSLIALMSGWRWLHTERASGKGRPAPTATSEDAPALWRTLFPLVLIIIVTQSVSLSALNFTPKLFTELGFSPTYVGVISGLFMFGSAAGGLVGGAIADRTGGKAVILSSLLGAVVPLFLYIPAGEAARFFWLFTAGFFVGMPHSILVLMAHALLPGRRALASGLTLGFMFFSGAIGTYILGLVADQVGLAQALQGTAFLPLLAVGVVPLLPAAKER